MKTQIIKKIREVYNTDYVADSVMTFVNTIDEALSEDVEKMLDTYPDLLQNMASSYKSLSGIKDMYVEKFEKADATIELIKGVLKMYDR